MWILLSLTLLLTGCSAFEPYGFEQAYRQYHVAPCTKNCQDLPLAEMRPRSSRYADPSLNPSWNAIRTPSGEVYYNTGSGIYGPDGTYTIY